jgi:hypothetical protein
MIYARHSPRFRNGYFPQLAAVIGCIIFFQREAAALRPTQLVPKRQTSPCRHGRRGNLKSWEPQISSAATGLKRRLRRMAGSGMIYARFERSKASGNLVCATISKPNPPTLLVDLNPAVEGDIKHLAVVCALSAVLVLPMWDVLGRGFRNMPRQSPLARSRSPKPLAAGKARPTRSHSQKGLFRRTLIFQAPCQPRRAHLDHDTSSACRKRGVPRSAISSRIMSSFSRRLIQGEIALRKRDFIFSPTPWRAPAPTQ